MNSMFSPALLQKLESYSIGFMYVFTNFLVVATFQVKAQLILERYELST